MSRAWSWIHVHCYQSLILISHVDELLQVMDSAIAAFCLEVIALHGEPAPRLCNKDPLTLKMGSYVLELFPNAKFLFMVRDGRATVHSIISRKVSLHPPSSTYHQSISVHVRYSTFSFAIGSLETRGSISSVYCTQALN